MIPVKSNEMDANEMRFIEEFEAAMADATPSETAAIAIGIRVATGLTQYEQAYGCETDIEDIGEPYLCEDNRTVALEVQTTNGDAFVITFAADEARELGLHASLLD